MTSHELAREILSKPDLPVQLRVEYQSEDGLWGLPGEVRTDRFSILTGKNACLVLWAYAEEDDDEESGFNG